MRLLLVLAAAGMARAATYGSQPGYCAYLGPNGILHQPTYRTIQTGVSATCEWACNTDKHCVGYDIRSGACHLYGELFKTKTDQAGITVSDKAGWSTNFETTQSTGTCNRKITSIFNDPQETTGACTGYPNPSSYVHIVFGYDDNTNPTTESNTKMGDGVCEAICNFNEHCERYIVQKSTTTTNIKAKETECWLSFKTGVSRVVQSISIQTELASVITGWKFSVATAFKTTAHCYTMQIINCVAYACTSPKIPWAYAELQLQQHASDATCCRNPCGSGECFNSAVGGQECLDTSTASAWRTDTTDVCDYCTHTGKCVAGDKCEAMYHVVKWAVGKDTSNMLCKSCESGAGKLRNTSHECVPCLKGYYRTKGVDADRPIGNTDRCTPCPSGETTAQTGTHSKVDCFKSSSARVSATYCVTILLLLASV